MTLISPDVLSSWSKDGSVYRIETPKERDLRVRRAQQIIPLSVGYSKSNRRELTRGSYTLKLFSVHGKLSTEIFNQSYDFLNRIYGPTARGLGRPTATFERLIEDHVPSMIRKEKVRSRKPFLDGLSAAPIRNDLWVIEKLRSSTRSQADREQTLIAALKEKRPLRFEYRKPMEVNTSTGLVLRYEASARRVVVRDLRKLRNGDIGFNAERCDQVKTYRLSDCANMQIESGRAKAFVPEAELRLEVNRFRIKLTLEQSAE